jgi:hypothetical protein
VAKPLGDHERPVLSIVVPNNEAECRDLLSLAAEKSLSGR